MGGCSGELGKQRIGLGEGRGFAARARSESESWTGPLVDNLGTLNTKSLRDTDGAGSE